MFLFASGVLFVAMLMFGPAAVSPGQHQALGITFSVFVGFFGFFLCGGTRVVAESDRSGWVKIGICSVAALVAGGLVFAVWSMGWAPIPLAAEP